MTTHDDRQTELLRGTVARLEDELRDTRVVIAKLVQALDESRGQVWELSGRLAQVEDAVQEITPQLAGILAFDDQLHQIREGISVVHEQGIGAATRVAELERELDSSTDHERQTANELSRRLDAVERYTQGTGVRFDSLDEASRRSMETVMLLRRDIEDSARATEAVGTRLARVIESSNRVDQEFGRIAGDLDGLHKQDELIAERAQVYGEAIKRVEGQISTVAADVAVKHNVIEGLELLRVETHRLEGRISGLEAAAGLLHERDEETVRHVSLVDGKQRGLVERLTGLQSDFAGYRDQVSEQFQWLHQLQERLKRRQLEELERDLREMRVHAFRVEEAWERRDT